MSQGAKRGATGIAEIGRIGILVYRDHKRGLAVSLLNMLRGNATAQDPAKVQADLEPLLIEGEQVAVAFKTVRDQLVFTNLRFISIDRMGLTGRKVNYRSIPYGKITMYSAETAGSLDSDVELALWVGSDPNPIKFDIGRSVDIRAVYKVLSHYILTR